MGSATMAMERLFALFDDPFLTPHSASSSLQLAPLNEQANRHSLPRLPRPLEPTAVPSRDASNQYAIKPSSTGTKQDRPKSIQDIVNITPGKRQKRAEAQSTDESKLELPPIESIDSSTIRAPIEPPAHALPGLQGPPTSFTELLNRNVVPDVASLSEVDSKLVETDSERPKERKKRNKWSTEETEDLLRGVALYGIGSWKKILNHDGFKFDGRTAIDLKDRFRTCRPQDYKTSADAKARSESDGNPDSPSLGSPSAKAKKARKPAPSHRKSSADLALLGIDRPFTKSSRRERRAFNEEEDASLMRGYQIYGAAWSKMRSDPSLNLSHRRATDLRDRFRNRFPDRYAEAGFKPRPKGSEKSSAMSREKSSLSDTEMAELPESVEMSVSSTLPRTESSASLGGTNGMDTTLDFPLSPTIPNLILDQPQNSSAEHDFNRLLLDDDIPPFTPVHNTRLPPFAPSKPYENNLPPLALDPATLTLSSQSMGNSTLVMSTVQLPPPSHGGNFMPVDTTGKSFMPNMQFQPIRNGRGTLLSSTRPSIPSMVSADVSTPMSGGLFSMSMPAIVAPAWEEIGANEMFDIDGGLHDGR